MEGGRREGKGWGLREGPHIWGLFKVTIAHKKITELIPKQFRFGNSSTIGDLQKGSAERGFPDLF